MIDTADAVELARHWWKSLSHNNSDPLPSDAQENLLGLVHRLAYALESDPFTPTPGAVIGSALVASGFSGPTLMARTATVLAELPDYLRRRPEREYRIRLAALLGAVGDGVAEAIRRQTADALQASETRFRVIYDSAPISIAVGDVTGRLLDVNTTMRELLGHPIERLRGTSVFDYIHPDDVEDFRIRIYKELVGNRGGTVRLEKRFMAADSQWHWGYLAVTYVAGVGGRDDYLLAIGEDITERRMFEAQLHHQARHDPLTGLPNRTQLSEALGAALAAAGPDDQVGLCLFDLDGFKIVNDTYGHGVGDRLLTAVAQRLQECAIRNKLLLARMGGDEFVAFIRPPTQEALVIAAAQELVDALIEPFELSGRTLQVSASVGVTCSPAAGADPESLIDTADMGMYRSKADRLGPWG